MGTRNSAALALVAALVAAPAAAEHHEAAAADTTAVQEIEEAPAATSEPLASQGSVARAQFALEVVFH